MIKFNKIQHKTINHLKGKLPVDFDNQLNNLLNKIKTRAEYEISDTHFYRTINEHFQNANKKLHCKSIAMNISQDEADKSQHILEISILHPSMTIENKRPLAAGNKKTILNFLNNSGSIELIKNDILQMSERLKDI